MPLVVPWLKIGTETFGAFRYIYPVVPWFVADTIFYFGVYVNPLLGVTKTGNDVKKSKID